MCRVKLPLDQVLPESKSLIQIRKEAAELAMVMETAIVIIELPTDELARRFREAPNECAKTLRRINELTEALNSSSKVLEQGARKLHAIQCHFGNTGREIYGPKVRSGWEQLSADTI